MTFEQPATLFPLFSTPIYVNNNLKYNCKNVVDVLEICEWKKTFFQDAYITCDQNILLNPSLKNIKEIVEDNIKNFVFNILKISEKYELKHVCSWAALHEKNNFSPPHMHQNSMFSGVIYIKVPPNSGNGLYILNDYNHPTYNTQTINPDIEEYNVFNSKTFKIDVDEKTIIIFPSHAVHSTDRSMSEDKRYCISFNYILSGEYNRDTCCLKI